jgi:hypothetical protein
LFEVLAYLATSTADVYVVWKSCAVLLTLACNVQHSKNASFVTFFELAPCAIVQWYRH